MATGSGDVVDAVIGALTVTDTLGPQNSSIQESENVNYSDQDVDTLHEGHQFLSVLPGSCDTNKYELRCDSTIWLNRQIQVCDSVYNTEVKSVNRP